MPLLDFLGEKPRMYKVLLVGGSGYVGREFSKQLSEFGLGTQSISRANGFDILKNNDLIARYSSENFDYCVVLSPISKVNDNPRGEEKEHIKRILDLNFRELSKIIRSKIIFFSSNNVFSGRKGPYNATETPDGNSWFAHSKLYAEELCKKYFENYAIVRTSMLIDESFSSAFLSWVTDRLSSQEVIKVRDDIVISPTLVSSVVADCINILQSNTLGLVHLSSHLQATKYTIACAVARVANLNQNLVLRESQVSNYLVSPGNYCLVSNYPGKTLVSASEISELLRSKFD